MNSEKIEKQVHQYANILLHEKGYVSPIDLFIKIGWLTNEKVELWCFGKVPYLEKVATANLNKLKFCITSIKKYAMEHQLKPSATVYKSWGKGPKRVLKFSKSGNPHMENEYSTHYVRMKKWGE